MEKGVRRHKRINLALAVAEGESIDAWAKENGVSERTAFYWAKDPKVRREVVACRRRALNQAIGRLTGIAMNAAAGIVSLAQEAEAESVTLWAWRAALADQMAVSRFSDREYPMAEIEERLRERTGHTDQAEPGVAERRPSFFPQTLIDAHSSTVMSLG
jgi:hypothetical protein